jgi:hypothetical protein
VIDKIISDLVQIATEAKAHYQVWWAIEHDGRATFERTLHRYQDFFEATRVAHFRSMAMAAWKPFDRDIRVSSLANLVRSGSSFLSAAEVSAVQAHLAKSSVIDGLSKIRHLFVAHQNAGLSTEEIFNLADITPNDLRDLIYQTADLVNQIARSRGRTNCVFESDRGFNSTIQLLTALQSEPSAVLRPTP